MPPPSQLRLIKHSLEYLPQDEKLRIPKRTRGIYVLYKQRGRKSDERHHYDFVYIGMATSSIRQRINSHIKKKGDLWTHFSFFEVWDNVQNQEIAELEGLFRHLYRYDSRANALNVQRGYKPLTTITRKTEAEWSE